MYIYIYTRPHKLLSFNFYRVKIKVTYLLTYPQLEKNSNNVAVVVVSNWMSHPHTVDKSLLALDFFRSK